MIDCGGDAVCVCGMWLCRIGIGFSANGMMAGPVNAVSNAVICSPANGTVGQFDFLNATFQGIVPDNTAGTTGLTLNWNIVGDRLDFQAVYSGVAWCVAGVEWGLCCGMCGDMWMVCKCGADWMAERQ